MDKKEVNLGINLKENKNSIGPKVKAPITSVTIFSKDSLSLKSEIDFLRYKNFDLLEIRGDYFIENFRNTFKEKKFKKLGKEDFENNFKKCIIEETKNFVKNLKKTFKNKQIIFTLRSTSEGGFFTGEDELYFDIINLALKEDIDYIDIEVQRIKSLEKDLESFYFKSKDYKKDIILSYHKVKGPLQKDEIISLYNDMEKYSPKIIKIVYKTEKKEDIYSLFEASFSLNKRKTKYSLLNMGKYGYVSRYLALPLGSYLVFAKGYKASVKGQVNLDKLNLFYNSYMSKVKKL